MGVGGMTDITDELPREGWFHRLQTFLRLAALIASPAICVVCAVAVGYFAHGVINAKPAPDVSKLAVSILKSDNVSPEMQDWAFEALCIQTEAPPAVGSIKPARQ